MNKSISLGAIGLLCFVTTTFAVDRLTIQIFPYSSVGNINPGLVQDLLRQKIERLAEETVSAHPDLHELNEIKVLTMKDTLPTSPQALAKYWKESPDSLEILSGLVFASPVVITSSVYLGEFNGSLITKTVTVQTNITPSEFSSYRDMHGALTLYALAMNAKARDPRQRGVISQYLAEAESLLKNIAAKSIADPDGNAIALSDAVAKELAGLKP